MLQAAKIETRKRTILFLGNCQAASLAELYADHIAPGNGDAVGFVASTSPISEADLAKILAADVIVEQVFDFKQYIAASDLDLSAHVIRFPTVSCAFLWPFTGGTAPAKAVALWPEGSYFGPDLNDRFLNKMIDDGTDPDIGVARYLDLDADAMSLDKRYDFVVRRQRRRDEVAGSRIAEVIEAHFREEQLFFSPFHPGKRIFRVLMSDILEKLGFGADTISRMEMILTRSLLDVTWLPIHPAVAAHFGLDYVAADQRYRSLDGSFTFAEWAERYMRFGWNRWLAKGEALHDQSEVAIENLRIGLFYSPHSAHGHRLLGEHLYRVHQFEHAVAALRRAIQLDPDEPRYKTALGHALAATGDPAGAVAAFQEAAEQFPNDPGLQSSLSHALCAIGRFEEAMLPARRALDLDPARRAWNGHHANLYALCERFAEADLAYREALDLEPDSAVVHAAFAEMLTIQERFDEAIAVMRRAVLLEPTNPRWGVQFAELFVRQEAARQADQQTARERDNLPTRDNLPLQKDAWRVDSRPTPAIRTVSDPLLAFDVGASELGPSERSEGEDWPRSPANGQQRSIAAEFFGSAD